MKKLIVMLLVLALTLTAVFANGSKEAAQPASAKATKIGFVVINDESDQGYTWNFMNGMDAAIEKLKAEGYNVELLVKRHTTESAICKDNNLELAGEGCEIIFNNSYGFEPHMLEAAREYPDVKFVGMTNCGGQFDDNPNTYNAFASIYEGRYVAGVVAGLKLNQLIAEGKIKADQAIVGYVGAYSFAEVISGMTSYFLGVRSVCPSATMKVYFVGTWGDATLEEAAANALIDKGCVMISQHSDTTSPALAAQKAGVFHTGYNTDMTGVAPQASLISCRINWEPYFYSFIKNHIDGKENKSDYTGTMAEGAVEVTKLNAAIAAPGTQAKIEEVEADIKSGKIQVFDTSKFTVDNGQKLTHAFAIDTDGDFAPDKDEAVFDGAFHESLFQSAPYFAIKIDGIEWLNAAY